ncbi:MAG: MerR family transcriptional regulator, partial [Anaerolineaceae bacterium]
MQKKERLYLRTCDLARAAGVHVNTVRMYEKWKLIPPVERAENRYRRYTRRHLHCLLLARMIYHEPYPGPMLRQAGQEIIKAAVAGDYALAREWASEYHALVRDELDQAEKAAAALEQWAAADDPEGEGVP